MLPGQCGLSMHLQLLLFAVEITAGIMLRQVGSLFRRDLLVGQHIGDNGSVLRRGHAARYSHS